MTLVRGPVDGPRLVCSKTSSLAGFAHFTKGPMFIGSRGRCTFHSRFGFVGQRSVAGRSGCLYRAGHLGRYRSANDGSVRHRRSGMVSRFWAVDDENQRQTQTLPFRRKVTFLGAALTLSRSSPLLGTTSR